MGLTRDKKREYQRDYMRRKRSNKEEGLTGEGLTQYPAILHALTDPGRRHKLERICQSLKEHNVLSEVRYGVSGPTFDVVAELLEVT